nr:hypothetical protein HK105_008028 [Polyrhizophydium stewartii]
MNGLARRLMHARAGLLVPLRVRRAVPASELGVRYDRPLVLVEAEPAQGDSAAPPRLALSFAPGIRAGAALRPETVIGWLSDMPAAGGQIDPKLFTGNAEFERLLNAVLSEHIHEDRGAQALAQHQKEGFLNINDERVFSPWGRVRWVAAAHSQVPSALSQPC